MVVEKPWAEGMRYSVQLSRGPFRLHIAQLIAVVKTGIEKASQKTSHRKNISDCQGPTSGWDERIDYECME